MFSLIIALISTALVAGLCIATVSYFGYSFQKTGTEVSTAKLMNETQQIQAAITMYRADHQDALPSSLDALVSGNYLSGLPHGQWGSNAAFIQSVGDVDDAVCLSFNKKKGIPFVPSCADPAYQSTVVCCDADLPPPDTN